MFRKLFLLFGMCFMLSACMEGGFGSNYQPVMAPPDGQVSYCSGDPRTERLPRASDQEIIRAMRDKGYVLIGQAEWTGPAYEDNSSAKSQGKKVGACLVMWGRARVGERQVERAVSVTRPAERIVITERHRHGKTVEKVIDKPARTETEYVVDTVVDFSYKGMFFARLVKPQEQQEFSE